MRNLLDYKRERDRRRRRRREKERGREGPLASKTLTKHINKPKKLLARNFDEGVKVPSHLHTVYRPKTVLGLFAKESRFVLPQP